MVPVNDLGIRTYKGYLGGLYPKGANNPPPRHLAAGIDIAANQVKPLDSAGAVDLANGKIVFISVGMSNTTDEFSVFVPLANADPAKNPQLVIVDGAQGGQDASKWIDPNAATWTTVNSRLATASVTPAQVEVAWVKQALADPNALGAFPKHAQILQSDLEAVARNLKTNYPNIKVTYFSSRTRAYTNDPTTLNPEPFAYESAFSVRWSIEDQLNGAGNLNFDPNKGVVVAPWMAWAPYLWADGTNPRSDGFTWLCSDLESDFTHPSTTGRNKVAHELLAFFKTHPTATPWFLRSAVTGQPPTVSATANPTSGVVPLTVNFSASATDQDGTIAQYVWTFDDGDFSFAQNPTKSFPAPGFYNVRLTVTDNSGNTVTKTLPITVRNTYQTWRTMKFSAAQLADPNVSGDTADPDHDGLANFAEYAFGLDPFRPDVDGAVPSPAIDGTHFALIYNRSDAATDISYSIVAADSIFGPWLPAQVTEQILDDDNVRQRVEATDSNNSGTPRFLRLQISLTSGNP